MVLSAATADVLKQTSEIRQLAILRPVQSSTQSRPEIERMIVKNLDEETTPAQIHAAYNVMRGVVVDAGQHQVVLVYRPTSVYIGVVLALLGIALCLFLRFSRLSKLQIQ